MNLGVGVNTANDTDIIYYDDGGTFGGTSAEDTIGGSIDFDSAFASPGTVGYDFGLIRADVEVDYSRSKMKSLTVKTLNGTPVTLTAGDADDLCDYLEANTCAVSGNTISIDGSRTRQLSVLANVWLDLPVGETVVPYLGGDLDVGGYELDGEGKAAFAWQLGAGAAFKLSDSFAITVDYRYRQISSSDIAYGEDEGVRISARSRPVPSQYLHRWRTLQLLKSSGAASLERRAAFSRPAGARRVGRDRSVRRCIRHV